MGLYKTDLPPKTNGVPVNNGLMAIIGWLASTTMYGQTHIVYSAFLSCVIAIVPRISCVIVFPFLVSHGLLFDQMGILWPAPTLLLDLLG